ncbi:NADH-quinone oxidoreductase subunit J [Planctomycetota bacterium]|nr:NADH-quinone oxidoreductase subunit J [Planctomycetota bacterium]
MTIQNVLAQSTETQVAGLASPIVIYIASLLGAVAVYLLMPKNRFNWRFIGTVLGLASLVTLWGYLSKTISWQDLGITNAAYAYYYVFSAISIIAAVRVITHRKPIYSALWFVLVVLSSAGLFVTLSAQFMAFAMVIIYGGAILVTYMFVIMLASHSGGPEHEDEGAEYDTHAREPLFAIIAGGLLMAVLLNVWFTPANDGSPTIYQTNAQSKSDDVLINNYLNNRAESATSAAIIAVEGEEALKNYAGQEQPQLTNIEKIGLNLFNAHPLALEIAGVILLISLIGAIVIARTQVPDEDNIKSRA